ncbi:helix-turn-helix domain-containing protein [Sphaerisporangium sp. NBC_01403]|uniref:helix-turn-helix domain-containing protein n=1 Tax=Sphaerisporangium sp. NBC_01403 TaxID=2903599 RepID=UPI00324337DD
MKVGMACACTKGLAFSSGSISKGLPALLGLSRPFVTRLLDEGEIPSQRLPGSNHRLVRLADVLEFQERREHRAEGRRRIMEVAEEADLPY